MYHLFFIYYQISLVILLGSDLYDLLANAQCYFTAANVPLYYSLYHNWFYQPGFYFIDCCPVFILLIVVISLHEKLVHPNKSHWNMIFLVSSGKMKFLFPENMILFFRRKMKYDLSQKLHGSMIFSSNVLKRWFFQNRPGI